jgi:hypothetical protein
VISITMIEDGTKYGTEHEKYRISGVVMLSDLAEHPHPISNYHLSPRYNSEKIAIQNRLCAEEWRPTLERNRLTAKITSSTWVSIVRKDSIQLEDGRHYPRLVIPKEADVKIEKGAALLAVIRSSPVGIANLSQASTAGGPKWCIVDFLLHGMSMR